MNNKTCLCPFFCHKQLVSLFLFTKQNQNIVEKSGDIEVEVKCSHDVVFLVDRSWYYNEQEVEDDEYTRDGKHEHTKAENQRLVLKIHCEDHNQQHSNVRDHSHHKAPNQVAL